MNKILLILLVGLFANNAMASRARLSALGQSNYAPATDLSLIGNTSDGTLLFKDARNIFLNPAQVAAMGNSFNFEFGPKTPTAAANAEGGMMYDMAGGKLGVQLGRQTDINKTMTTLALTTTPGDNIDVIYGRKGASVAWGVGLHYGDAKSDATTGADTTANQIIVSGGMAKEKLEVYGHAALAATSENTTAGTKFEGKSYIKAGIGYQIDNISKIVGQVFKNGFETGPNGGRTEHSYLNMDVRYAHLHKPKTDLMFFYGAGFTNITGDRTTAGVKTDVTVQQIPVFIGLEGSATSWMDLRASVTQEVLLNTTKNPTLGTAGESQHKPNTTTVGAGATLKFTNFTVDATLAAAGAATANIDGNSLFANASLLYNF